MTFLQLGEIQVHRNVLEALKYTGMTKEEQLLTLVPSGAVNLDVNNAEHTLDPQLTTES
jgi:hypothetical protein